MWGASYATCLPEFRKVPFTDAEQDVNDVTSIHHVSCLFPCEQDHNITHLNLNLNLNLKWNNIIAIDSRLFKYRLALHRQWKHINSLTVKTVGYTSSMKRN